VPILLILLLAVVGSEFLARQLAVYLVTSELDRRVENLRTASSGVELAKPADRPGVVSGMIDLFYLTRFPGIDVLVREPNRTIRYPIGSSPAAPHDGWGDVSGLLIRDGQFFLWSHNTTSSGNITITAPLTREFLA